MSRDDWLWDGTGEPDPEDAAIAEALGTLRYRGEPPRLRRRTPRWPLLLAASALLAAGVAWVAWPVAQPQGWAISAAGGCPDDDCLLTEGEWLEPDRLTEVRVADIGYMQVAADARLRLKRTGRDEHRLELARGMIHASVVAPPRLLVVETPSATAVDLGCSYDLAVDDAGNAVIEVHSGWVALETPGREVFVPAGARAETLAGVGPLSPYFPDASAPFLEARLAIDCRPPPTDWAGCDAAPAGSGAVDTLIAEARPRDTLTMWHVLPEVDAHDRERLVDAMIAFDPQIEADKSALIALEPTAMQQFRRQLEFLWLFSW